MFSTYVTRLFRRSTARSDARAIAKRIKAEATRQGLNLKAFRRSTCLDKRGALRVWIGQNPSIVAIERSREVLGLSIEQVWKVR